MKSKTSADHIQRQMSAVRKTLTGELSEVVGSARQLSDWRYYLRAHPWGSLGVVAALGYFAVPRRVEIVSPDEQELQKLAKKNRLVVQHRPAAQERRGIASSAAELMANMLMRAGIAYLGQQVGRLIGEQAADDVPKGVPK